MRRYQKGETNLDFTETRDSEWQWHQLGHMQVCTSLQTDNHTSTPPLSFYRPDALPATQPTASKHWRQRLTLRNVVVLAVILIGGYCMYVCACVFRCRGRQLATNSLITLLSYWSCCDVIAADLVAGLSSCPRPGWKQSSTYDSHWSSARHGVALSSHNTFGNNQSTSCDILEWFK